MNTPRRPKMFFEEAPRPTGVTFDDGRQNRWNLPWMRFAHAEWDYADPATIRVEIGDWQVVLTGHNLEPLFAAIERGQLLRVRAHPEFADDPAHDGDVYVTSIRFVHLDALARNRRRGAQLKFPFEE